MLVGTLTGIGRLLNGPVGVLLVIALFRAIWWWAVRASARHPVAPLRWYHRAPQAEPLTPREAWDLRDLNDVYVDERPCAPARKRVR